MTIFRFLLLHIVLMTFTWDTRLRGLNPHPANQPPLCWLSYLNRWGGTQFGFRLPGSSIYCSAAVEDDSINKMHLSVLTQSDCQLYSSHTLLEASFFTLYWQTTAHHVEDTHAILLLLGFYQIQVFQKRICSVKHDSLLRIRDAWPDRGV